MINLSMNHSFHSKKNTPFLAKGSGGNCTFVRYLKRVVVVFVVLCFYLLYIKKNSVYLSMLLLGHTHFTKSMSTINMMEWTPLVCCIFF